MCDGQSRENNSNHNEQQQATFEKKYKKIVALSMSSGLQNRITILAKRVLFLDSVESTY